MAGPDRARLLVVDDDEEACRLLEEVLSRDGYEVQQATSVSQGLSRVATHGPFDAVLTDLRMPGQSGLDLVKAIRERDPSAVVIVLTGFGDAAAAGAAIRAGAHDFISKPYDIAELRAILGRALARRRLAAERSAATAPLGDEPEPGRELVGHSPAIIGVMKTVARVAPTQASVLITGETGTGKELVARIIHQFSDRAQHKFVSVNCAALAEGVLESELFGHVRGAFTGAVAARPGLFREADRGTLFLDEIGDVTPALQTRLLRAIQEREITPVGSESPVKVDVRVIAATHRDLEALVRDGAFREDLFYRLNVVSIHLPPLRERRQDIPLLVDATLRGLARKHHRGPVALDPEAQALLLRYDWPGNVRQLQNVLERSLVLAEQDVIGPEHLPPELRENNAAPGASGGGGGVRLVPLAQVEREHVLAVLAACQGNRERAARVLRISRRTLSRMLQRWGLTGASLSASDPPDRTG